MTGRLFVFTGADGADRTIDITKVHKAVQSSPTEVTFVFSPESPEDRLVVTDTLANIEATTGGVLFRGTYQGRNGNNVTEMFNAYRVRRVIESAGGLAIVEYQSQSGREDTYQLTDTFADINSLIAGAISGGSGSTNLAYSGAASSFQITSSSGTNATVPAATGALAGAKLPTPTLPANATGDADGAADLIEVWDNSLGGYVQMSIEALLAVNNPDTYTIPAPAFSDPENPTEAEVLTYISGLPTAPKPNSVFRLIDGASVKNGSTGNPEITWTYDGTEVVRDKDVSRKYEIPGGAFADAANPTRAEIITWLASNPTNGAPVILYLIGSGSEEAPDFVWIISTDNAVSPGDIIRVNAPATPSGSGFAWYSTGVKTIKLYSTADSSGWLTESAVGTYDIVVPAGQALKRISYLSTTAAGASQNTPAGAINFVIDDSANSRNQTIADASPIIAVGIDVTDGDTYPLGTLNANAHTVNTTFAAGEMTVRLAGFPGQFADGSKIVVKNLDGE